MSDRTPQEILDGLGAQLRAAEADPHRRPGRGVAGGWAVRRTMGVASPARRRGLAAVLAFMLAVGGATVATGGPWAPSPPGSLDASSASDPVYVLDGGGDAWWRLSVRECRRDGATWPVVNIRVADGGAGRSCTVRRPGPQLESYVDVPRDRTLVFGALPLQARTVTLTLEDGASVAAPAVESREPDGRRYVVAEVRGVRLLRSATVAGAAGVPLARCDAEGACR